MYIKKFKRIFWVVLTIMLIVTMPVDVYAAKKKTPKASDTKINSEDADDSNADRQLDKTGKSEKSKKEEQIDYTLYVNRALGFLRVTKLNPKDQEVQVKVMKCSVGRTGHATPKGTFKTSDYYEWRLMVDNTYAQYAVRFNNHIMFHSVPYHKSAPDTLEWDQYNLLGKPASLGCVRLTVADAKWIYDHCRKGTTVVVYDDVSEKVKVPETKTIRETSINRGWDPTDPDPENPWND